ncbi:hypothetical protein AR687_08835 [Flavobacteriaceae bacterium CRH]|nr:hypothetical protein AR687_08835 [Flavobacteriaceae bacterium CRH]
MEKHYIILLFLCFTSVFAQDDSKTEVARKTIVEIEKSKTGNFKDAFYNIIQLTTKNFSEDEKSLELNTTLFKIIYNSELSEISDLTILKSYVLRNFQINAKTNFDKNFKYNGISGGITFAVINNRDNATIKLAKTIYGKNREAFMEEFRTIQSDLSAGKPEGKDLDLLNNASDTILNGYIYDSSKNPYYDQIQIEFKKRKKFDGKAIETDEITDYIKALNQLRQSEIKKIESKVLWTFSADGSTNTDGKFDKYSIGTVFLKGIPNTNEEIDIRGKFTYADTTLVKRSAFNGKVGLNMIILRNKQENISCFEIKVLGEYNKIFKNLLPDEEDETISANAEFRIRLAKDFWIPITIKYDTEKSNFLGFLNVTYNFGDFKN